MSKHMRYKELWRCSVDEIKKFVWKNQDNEDPDTIIRVNAYKEVLYIMGRLEEAELERVGR